MPAFTNSPGIVVQEIDLTGSIPQVPTTTGAFVGDFLWGPVLLPTLVTSEGDLANRFFTPGQNNFQSWFTAANFLAYGNSLQLVRVVDPSARNATANVGVVIRNEADYQANAINGQMSSNAGIFAARYPGSLGNSIEVSICPSANAFQSSVYGISNGNVVLAQANTIAGNNYIIFNSTVTSNIVAGDFLTVGSNPPVEVLSISNNNVAVSGTVTANQTSAYATRNWQFYRLFNGSPNTSPYVANLGGAYDEIHVVVSDATGLITGVAGTVLETYPYASKAFDAKKTDGSINYYLESIHGRSNWIWWTGFPSGAANWGANSANTTFSTPNYPTTVQLQNGVDSGVPSVGALEAGYDLMSDPDKININLIMTGPWGYTLQQYVILNTAFTSRKDCVVFCGPAMTDVVQQQGNEISNLQAFRSNLLVSSSYAFVVDNWKYMYDKYNDKFRWVPLDGDIAGLCVRTDMTNDPWWSPAGTTRGQIKNIVKLAWNANQAQRDLLYALGINSVISNPTDGTILFGDKTLLSRPSAFDRINVRRLFIVLEEAISKAARNQLFEFNDSFTQAAFKAMVDPYLRSIKGSRGIIDYQIVCDSTVNTPQIVNNNQFVAQIYVQPAHSINFICLQFIAVATGVSFSEIIGQY